MAAKIGKRMTLSALAALGAVMCVACSPFSTRTADDRAHNCVSESDCLSRQFCCTTADSPTGCDPGVCSDQVKPMAPQPCGRSAECGTYPVSDHEIGFSCCCEENTAPGTTMRVCVPAYTCAAGKLVGIARGCI